MGLAKKVEGCGGLWNESAPEVHGKVWIKAAEASDEMIFPSADGFFRGVTSMVVRRNELEGNGICAHVGLQAARGFVIEALEYRFEAACLEVVVKLGVGS